MHAGAVACLVGPAIYVRNRTAIFAVGARVRAAVEHLFFALFVDKLPMSEHARGGGGGRRDWGPVGVGALTSVALMQVRARM